MNAYHHPMRPVLGLDFGGVIKPMTPLAGAGDTQFGTDLLLRAENYPDFLSSAR